MHSKIISFRHEKHYDIENARILQIRFRAIEICIKGMKRYLHFVAEYLKFMYDM